MFDSLGRGVDDKIDLVAQDQVHQIRGRLFQFVGADCVYAVFLQHFGCASGRIDAVADFLEPLCDRNDVLFVLVFDGDDHIFMLRKIDACAKECFVQRFVEGLGDSQAFSGRFHLRSQGDVCAADLLEGEYRHLDSDVVGFFLQSRLVSHLADGFAQDHLCCQRYDRDSGYFADIRHGSGRTWIYLDHVDILTAYDKLDIDHSDDMQGFRKSSGVLYDGFLSVLADGLCRIYGNTVSGVYAGALDVFHDSRNQDICTVAYSIYLNFLALQVFVYQDRVLLCDPVDDSDKLIDIFITDRDLHALSSKYIGRTYQYRITQLIGSFLCFFRGKYGMSGRTRDLTFLQDRVEQLTVFRGVYVLCRSSKDRNAHLDQCLRQLDRSLSAELYHCTVRFLNVNNIFYIFRCQRLEIQFVCNVKVRADGFRVVVDDDRLISGFLECPGTVYGTEVELDSLSDTDRAGAKYQNFLSVMGLNRFVLTAVHGIIIRCSGSKLCRTGIYHLVGSGNIILSAQGFDLILRLSGEICDHIVRELKTFRFTQQILGQFLCLQRLLHLYQDRDLVNKPYVDLCDGMDLFVGNAAAHCLCNSPDSHIIDDGQFFHQFFFSQSCEIVGHQRIHMLLQGTDRFHQRALKAVADTHNLTGCLHLCGQRTFRADKLIEWKTRKFYDTVVQHRLKACVSLACDGIRDLIQSISQSDLCRYLCDRVSGRLGSQRGRTADTRVYLDDAVFKAVRIQCVLHVTSSGDAQLGDNVQRRSTQHLVLLVTQGLGWSHYDTVSGVNADRVNVFHITYGDAVSCTVAHYFILDFFPSGDAALYQNLANTGETQTVGKNLDQLLLIISDTAAASAQSVSRTKYNRIADLIGEFNTGLHIMYHQRCRYRLTDFFHRILEFLTVLCFLDRLRGGSDQADIVLTQESAFFQFHRQVQSRLSSQSRKYAVRLFLDDQLLHNLYGQRLNVNTVCDILVRHNGRRIGVQKHNLDAFLFQGTAGLCSCVVKLCSLSDNDRTGTNDQYFFNLRILWHY